MPHTQKRWPWWTQVREAVAAVAALIVLGVETWRGTYNILAMTFVLACLGVVGTGVLTRLLVGRMEDRQ
jgi:hypothetical protein